MLFRSIRSVQDQTFTDWELILVDDASPDDAVRRVLHEAAALDPRIQVVESETNGGIVVASNVAVDRAQGEWLVLLDHDDLLTSNALESVFDVLEPDVDYVYSDEDKIDDTGRTYDRFEKPEWSPERLRHQMYTSHLSALRTSLVREEIGRAHV